MVSGQELFAERKRIKRVIDSSLLKAFENGNEAAEKTRIYRMMLQQKILQLKEEGMAVTLIEKVAKGDPEVAQAEFEKNVADVAYRASLENIMAQKKFFDSIEADINREYYKGAEIDG